MQRKMGANHPDGMMVDTHFHLAGKNELTLVSPPGFPPGQAG